MAEKPIEIASEPGKFPFSQPNKLSVMNFPSTALLLIILLFVISFLTDRATKLILASSPYPLILTFIQFLISTILSALLLIASNSFAALKRNDLFGLFVVSLAHTIGFLTTNISLSGLSLGLVATVKASESLFTAAISRIFFKQQFSTKLYLSLIPIVLGVALASLSSVEFNWLGLSFAAASNVCFAARTTLASNVLNKEKNSMNQLNLYFYMSLISSVITFPVLFFSNYPISSSSYLTFLLNGVGHYTYNQLSIILLSYLSPVAHVVMHAVRRIFTLYAAAIVNNTQITKEIMAGSLLVMLGVMIFAGEKNKSRQRDKLSK
jgi:solute carrier family 35 protein E1